MSLLLAGIQRDNVGLLLDAWQWWVGGGDLEKLRGFKGEQVLSVRLADIPAGADFSTITEEQRLMPGDGGMIDSSALLSVLEEMGYAGPVAMAPSPSLFKGNKREATVRQVSEALDTLLATITAEKPLVAAPQ
jgi:sugar phosphate isomerase/epimerase